MQINITHDAANRRINPKYLVLVAAMAAMLVASTALATDNAFADKKKDGYKKSQAATQVNDCGNDDSPEDVFCQNLASQIQGDGNAVALEGEQGEEE